MKLKTLMKFWFVILLLVMTATLMPSHTVLARSSAKAKTQGARTQGKRTATRKAHLQQSDGATITGNKARLKPGYKFVKLDANTVRVEKRKGGGGKVLKCGCDLGNAAHSLQLYSYENWLKGERKAGGGCAVTWNPNSDVVFCMSQGCTGKCLFSLSR